MDGSLWVGVVVKQRFYVGRRRTERLRGADIARTDLPWDEEEPETSSIKTPSDMVLRKPGTDVLVVGAACAPGGKMVKTLDVLVQVGPLEKMLRVHGPRVFYRGTIGLSVTPAEAFESVPLKWELAWGGSDTGEDGKLREEPRNPVGRGVAADPKTLVHKPAPQIETPDDPVTSARGAHAPAGLGAIGRHWVPRRGWAGTYDETWKKTRMPLPPVDQDPRFHQAAPPDQVVAGYLAGGEPVRLGGLHADGPLIFELPRMSFYVGARIDGTMTEHPPRLDTVVLMPNERTLDMVWRSQVRVPRPLHRLEHIQVHERRRA
ncbi:MAG: DUF2169 domain-containing protein [Deltaproteobacteria bacterium]|nr:DUF2169 domain-containing protein [Deltaproteobacteria bacterium]